MRRKTTSDDSSRPAGQKAVIPAQPFFLAVTGREKSVFMVFITLKLLFDLASALPLSRPVVTDATDSSQARLRADEEIVDRPPA